LTRAIVFDKGYCHYGWWTAIANQGAVFVTRPKTNMGLDIVCERLVAHPQGDGFTVLKDREVRFASKRDSRRPIRLRRLLVQRTDGKAITLLTNDLERSGVDIAALYKARWQIELLFRWISSISTSAASSATTTTPSASRSLPRCSPTRCCASPPAVMASRSRSCASPIWSPCASSNAATSAPSKNPRLSTRAAGNAQTPNIS
jgi:hypothetical protein